MRSWYGLKSPQSYLVQRLCPSSSLNNGGSILSVLNSHWPTVDDSFLTSRLIGQRWLNSPCTEFSLVIIWWFLAVLHPHHCLIGQWWQTFSCPEFSLVNSWWLYLVLYPHWAIMTHIFLSWMPIGQQCMISSYPAFLLDNVGSFPPSNFLHPDDWSTLSPVEVILHK